MLYKLALSSVLAAVATTSLAADLPSLKGPPVFATTSAMSWAGFYAGGVVSVGMMTSNMQDYWCRVACDAPHDSKFGGGLGLTGGYNFQNGPLVYGLEADINWTNFTNHSGTTDGFSYATSNTAKWNGYATLRGRFGWAVERSFIYATAGAAFVSTEYSMLYTRSQQGELGFLPKKQIQTGFAVGVGLEHALTSNLSLKAEYMYIGLPRIAGGQSILVNGGVPGACAGRNCSSAYNSNAQLFRIGLNYRFNGAALPPIMASANIWDGFYIGGVATMGMTTSHMLDYWCYVSCDAPHDSKFGAGLGATVGYNMQSGSLVYGVEADASLINFNEKNGAPRGGFVSPWESKASFNSYGTLRGRLGVAFDRSLIYATAGAALVESEYSLMYTGGAFAGRGFRPIKQAQTGFAVGFGFEHALSQSLSLKAEYLYIGLPTLRGPIGLNANGTPACASDCTTAYSATSQFFRIGLNYRFGGAPLPPMLAAANVWNGFYVGGLASLGMMNSDMHDFACNVACDAPHDAKFGGGAGVTAGYNLQSGSLVYGLEADANWVSFTNKSGNVAGNNTPAATQQARWNAYGTLRGRLGVAFGNSLFYTTAGAAFVNRDYSMMITSGNAAGGGFWPKRQIQTGFAVSVGLEHALTQSLSVKAEYLYIGLPKTDGGPYRNPNGTTGCNPDCTSSYNSSAQLFRLGMNYKFGGDAAPVLAKY